MRSSIYRYGSGMVSGLTMLFIQADFDNRPRWTGNHTVPELATLRSARPENVNL